MIFLLEVDKSPLEITTHEWHCGCYWRKTRFHREKAFFLMVYVADLPLKVQNLPLVSCSQAALPIDAAYFPEEKLPAQVQRSGHSRPSAAGIFCVARVLIFKCENICACSRSTGGKGINTASAHGISSSACLAVSPLAGLPRPDSGGGCGYSGAFAGRWRHVSCMARVREHHQFFHWKKALKHEHCKQPGICDL
ncbi:MAG: hypothetical protein V4646_11685 [Pseudomonadota bacterium]